jgi:hypothetical protein
MREDHRAPTRIVVDDQLYPLTEPADAGPVADRSRRATIARRWRIALGAAMLAFSTYAVWHATRPALAPALPPISANWDLELTSAGNSPVTALVFGREAGLHFVTVPGIDASAEERRRIPARIHAGNVYMVSLGWPQLNVHTASPPGAPRMAFMAQARFIRIFSASDGTGISTSWRH